MPLRAESGGDEALSQVVSALGLSSPTSTSPTAPATASSAPTVSTTPAPGQGISLDINGRLPASIQQSTSGYEYAYTTIAAGATISATSFGSDTTLITTADVEYDGQTTILIAVYSPRLVTSTVATFLTLWMDSTQLGIIGQYKPNSAAAMEVVVNIPIRYKPAAGKHNFSVRGVVNSGTATFDAGAGGSGVLANAFLRVSRV